MYLHYYCVTILYSQILMLISTFLMEAIWVSNQILKFLHCFLLESFCEFVTKKNIESLVWRDSDAGSHGL